MLGQMHLRFSENDRAVYRVHHLETKRSRLAQQLKALIESGSLVGTRTLSYEKMTHWFFNGAASKRRRKLCTLEGT